MASINKKQTVENLTSIISSSSNLALIGFMNTTHQNLEGLRKELKKISAKLKVVKNSLIIKALNQLAIKDKKYKKLLEEVQNLKDKTALLCLADDYVAGLNAIEKLSKTDEGISFKLGLLEGNLYSSEKLKQIANLPSKDQLYFNIINQFRSPFIKLMYLINSPSYNLI